MSERRKPPTAKRNPDQGSALTSAPRPAKSSKAGKILPVLSKSTWAWASAIAIGVGVSAAVHITTVLLEFKIPEIKLSKQEDRGLDIVLVNAKHKQAPSKAQALAQANMDGGGNTDQKAMPSSPLPPEDTTKDGDALKDARRRLRELEEQQRTLLTKADALAKASVDADRKQAQNPDVAPETQRNDLRDQERAIAKQAAIIAKELREYAERPRKQHIGARTKEHRFALYTEAWREKIERMGTMNYPKTGAKKLYGSVLVSVEIRHDGSIIKSEISRSSGNPKLDEHALRVLQLSAPFAAFPADIRKDTDVLVISRTFTFLHEKLTADK